MMTRCARFIGTRPVFQALAMAAAILASVLGAFGGPAQAAQAPNPAVPSELPVGATDYIIGPGDGLQIFVWHNGDLSTGVTVRPDGKVSIPLVEDIICAGKTPTQLARDFEERLRKYIQDPTVTVMVGGFSGMPSQQIRIVGAASAPKAILFKENMSVLDAMIAVGGLGSFAAGNRTKLVRMINGRQVVTTLRLQNLLEDGDLSANVALLPGDVIIIPQSYF
jgi:polysaccharide export outer membrane protein